MQKKILSQFCLMLILVSCFVNIVRAAYVTGDSVDSYDDLPESITVKRAGVVFPTTIGVAYSNNDPLDLFTDDIEHGPALQYIDGIGTNIFDRIYVFCVSKGKTGADTGISYTKTTFETGLNNDVKIREIIKYGFGAEYTEEMNLRQAYYTTQVAIWVIQGTVDFPENNVYDKDSTDEAWKYNMYEDIKKLIEVGNNADTSNRSELIAKYKPENDEYQEIVPAIIYPVNPPVQITPPSTSIKTPSTTNSTIPKSSITYQEESSDEIVVEEETVESPQTGVISLVTLIMTLIASIILYIYSKKKTNIFKIGR